MKIHIFHKKKKSFKQPIHPLALSPQIANQALIPLPSSKSTIYTKTPQNKPITNPNKAKPRNRMRELPIMEMKLL